MHVAVLFLAATLSQSPAASGSAPTSLAAAPSPSAVAVDAAPPSTIAPAVAPSPQPPAKPTTASDRLATSPPAAPLRPTVWGFVDFQVSSSNKPGPPPAVSTAEFRRARIGVRGDVVPWIGYAVQYDVADTSLKDAYVALRLLPGAELRLGQFKTPFGYEQPESDTKLLWVYGSYVVQALARGRDSRDEGALLSGKWKIAGPLTTELAAAGVNGAGPNARDDLNEKNFWGRAGLALALGRATARLGGSYGYGHQVQSLGADAKFGAVDGKLDDTYAWFHTTGADLTVDTPWFFAAGEVIASRRHVQKFTGPGLFTPSNVLARGWYAGAYGKTPWSVGPVLRVEQYDPDAAATRDHNERYTLGAYYDVLPVNARFVLNYELDRSSAPVRAGDRFIAFAQVIF